VKKILCTILAIAFVAMLVPATASASCVSIDKKAGFAPRRGTAPDARVALGNAIHDPDDDQGTSIVGLWDVTFLFGNGPDVFDRGFEQWHSDGTEFTMDVAVPPAAGNICVGVWKQVGPRTVKLHHVGWNWDATQNPAVLAGTFVLDMTVTVNAHGHMFTGTYVTDSYDLNGVVIPALHAEGAVRGTRITVDN
jgi:hypothetical protein